MPDIDHTVDIKVNADRGMMTAEIPLAGHASEHWRERTPSAAGGGGSKGSGQPPLALTRC